MFVMPSRPASVAGRSCRPRCRCRRCAKFSPARRARRRAAIFSRGASMPWQARCSKTSRRASAHMRRIIRAGRAPSTKSIRRRSRSRTTAGASRSARTSTARSASPARTARPATGNMPGTSNSSARRSASCSRSTAAWGRRNGRTSACTSRRSCCSRAPTGSHTCSIEAWTHWHKTASAFLALPAEEMVFCGMALGHADPAAPINGWRSTREDLDGFANFSGFIAEGPPQC